MTSEDKAKKRVLMFIGIILVLIAILAIVLGLLNKKPKEDIQEVPSQKVEPKMNTEISLLKDEATFFGLQSVINQYFEYLATDDNNLYNLLDSEYIKENNITTSDVNIKINVLYNLDLDNNSSSEEYLDDITRISFTPKEIYYNANSTTTYYFINGYIDGLKVLDVNFLIIINNNSYVIRPLSNSIKDLEGYAKSYGIIYKEIDNNNTFKKSELSEENKLTLYLTEFKKLLYVDNNKAYSMLEEETLKLYPAQEYLENNKENIYNQLSTRIMNFGKIENEEYVKYTIDDYKDNRIYIYEYSPMNYKIDFELNSGE